MPFKTISCQTDTYTRGADYNKAVESSFANFKSTSPAAVATASSTVAAATASSTVPAATASSTVAAATASSSNS